MQHMKRSLQNKYMFCLMLKADKLKSIWQLARSRLKLELLVRCFFLEKVAILTRLEDVWVFVEEMEYRRTSSECNVLAEEGDLYYDLSFLFFPFFFYLSSVSYLSRSLKSSTTALFTYLFLFLPCKMKGERRCSSLWLD